MKYFLFFILLFSLIPAPKAQAQFLPDVASFQTLCRDLKAVGSLINLYQARVTVGLTSEAPGSMAQDAAEALSAQVPRICTMVLALNQVKDLDSALDAARIANDMYSLGLGKAFNFYDDTTSIVKFVDTLSKGGISKDEFLNVNNHRRLLNYIDKWPAPVLASATGMEIRVSEHRKRNAKLIARFNQATKLQNKIMGCKEEFKQLEKKLAAGEQVVGSEVYAQSDIARLIGDYNKADAQTTKSMKKISTYNSTLGKMLASALQNYDSAKLNSSLSILKNYVEKSWWVQVGYAGPSDPTLVAPKSIQVCSDNPTIATDSSTANGGATVTPNCEIQQDSRDQYYQGGTTKETIFCDQKEVYESERWLVTQGSVFLNDPYIKTSDIAKTVKACPDVSPRTEPLEQFVQVTSDDAVAKAVKDGGNQAYEDCRNERAQKIMKDLNGVNGFTAGGALNSNNRSDTSCELKKAQAERDIAQYKQDRYLPQEEIKTMNDFVDHYSKIFDSYVNKQYDNFKSEGAVQDKTRAAGTWFNSLGAGAGGGFANEVNNKQSTELSAFNRDFRTITRCDDPDYLIDNYPDAKTKFFEKDTVKDNGDSIRNSPEFAEIFLKCVENEKKVTGAEGLFKYMFDGLDKELKVFTQARATVVSFEIRSGALKVDAATKQKVCKKNMMPTDFAKFMAEGIMQVVDAMNDQIAITNANTAQEVKDKSEAQQLNQDLQIVKKRNAALSASEDSIGYFQKKECEGEGCKLVPDSDVFTSKGRKKMGLTSPDGI